MYYNKNRLEVAFNMFDVERGDIISLADVQKIIKDSSITLGEWNAMVSELGSQANRFLTFDAFVRKMSIQ
jgi:Ca2+-binding EF-hand superfamily protein